MKFNSRYKVWLLPLMICLAMGLLWSFGAGDLLGAEEGHKPGAKDETFWEMWQKGGFMMWIMLIVSIFAMSLIIENIVKLRNVKVVPPDLFSQVKTLVEQGNYHEAWRTARANASPFGRVVAAGLQRIGRGKDEVSIALEEHGMKEASVIKTKNNYLSVIGVVSPMLGLLGAVLGMIKAFKAIGEGTALNDPTKLAAAIGEVLVATAFGLFIAVPAFFSYYFFRNRASAVILALQDAVTEVMDRIPYGELQGIKIGEDLERELGGAAPAAAPVAAPAAVAAVTAAPAVAPAPVATAAAPQVSCPACNQPIAQGATPCPHCGAQIQWS